MGQCESLCSHWGACLIAARIWIQGGSEFRQFEYRKHLNTEVFSSYPVVVDEWSKTPALQIQVASGCMGHRFESYWGHVLVFNVVTGYINRPRPLPPNQNCAPMPCTGPMHGPACPSTKTHFWLAPNLGSSNYTILLLYHTPCFDSWAIRHSS